MCVYRYLTTTSLTLSLMSFCLLSGCELVEPKDVLSIQEKCAIGAYLSLSVVDRGDTAPTPSPTPSPSGDTCGECAGSGSVGDGVIMFKCDACNGTGRVQSGYELEELPSEILWDALENAGTAVAAEDDCLVTSGGRTFRREMRDGRMVYVPVE